MQELINRLRDLYRYCEGLEKLNANGMTGSDFVIKGDTVEIYFKYCSNDLGVCERKFIGYVMSRVKAKKLADDKVPSNVDEGFVCSSRQLKGVHRAIKYATPWNLQRPSTTVPPDEVPLSELLSASLQSFEEDYEKQIDRQESVSIPVNANFLRVLDTTPIDRRTIKSAAVLSNRVITTVLKRLVELGLVNEVKSQEKRGLYWVSLTAKGLDLRDKSDCAIAKVEKQWIGQYGSNTIENLRDCLCSLVKAQELEFPHHLTGYGPMDPALTGGDYIKEEIGPPYIPGRGQEWPVVHKVDTNTDSSATIPALLSKKLMQLDVDYNRFSFGNLFFTANSLSKFENQHMTLKQAQGHLHSVASRITGNGKSYLERHIYLVVDKGKPSDGSRLLHLTPKARFMRDSYPATTFSVEQEWLTRYGEEPILQLRRCLLEMVATRDNSYSEFPDPCKWIWDVVQKQYSQGFSVKQKS